MPAGIAPVVRIGWKPPAIGAKTGGGWLGAGGTVEPEENGRRDATPELDGAGSTGRVRGKPEADHRCGCLRGTPPLTAEPASVGPCRSVKGRISREDVVRCIGVRRAGAAS